MMVATTMALVLSTKPYYASVALMVDSTWGAS